MSLPENFSFVWNDRVAGSAHPGYGPSLLASLAALSDQGIKAIVSLHERALDIGPLREFAFDYLHMPIEDFTAPSQLQIDEVIQFMQGQLDQDRRVMVHCQAGIGRTGTILACFLVRRGMDAKRAISEIRHLRPGSMEVYTQEYCVFQYAERLENSTGLDTTP